MPKAYSDNTDIVINEIGAYEASGHEWVEIYNKGSAAVDLTDWKFWEAETNHGLSLIQGDDWILDPGEYAIITQNDVNFLADYPDVATAIFDSSWSSLNESGEEIGLKDAGGEFVEQFTYGSASDYSLERIDPDGLASNPDNWTEHPDSNTVGQQNYWFDNDEDPNPEENQPPVAVILSTTTAMIGESISLDGTGSSDPDGTVVSYAWKVDDFLINTNATTSYTFTTAGDFLVELTVTDDDEATNTADTTVTVSEPEEEPEPDPEPTSTSTIAIVINEFVSDPVSGEKEWIELYNNSTSTVDLTGWKLADGTGTISSPTSTLEAGGFVVITLSSSKLNNSGDIIILKNSAEEIVDQVSYGDWGDGNTGDNAPAASDPNSIARIVDGQDTGSDQNDFAETTTPTPGEANNITAPVVEETPPGGSTPGGGSAPTTPTINYNASDVVINEIVSDPIDGEEEFIELYNNTSNAIALDGWWLEDGSEAKTTLTGSIPAKGFFVIEKPSGNLNNSGDIVILFDPSGKEIDKMTYGTWDDGNTADNAPSAGDPMSLVRKIDGQDGNNDYYDFVLTTTITKGAANVITSVTEDGEIIEQATGSTDIIINEVLPNPKGTDGDDEFIELKNIGTETTNLVGWSLGDSTTKKYKITQGTIQPNSYIVFKRSMTSVALNNTGGDEVKLYNTGGTVVDSIKYTGSAGEDEAYARKDDNSWVWTTEPTPGKTNVIAGKSAAPLISIDTETEVLINEVIIFDASDTIDPDGDDMTFAWNFGDGHEEGGDVVEHKFLELGIFTVTLTVTDTTGNKSTQTVVITVKNGLSLADDEQTKGLDKIQISEIVPNPEGSDTTEFIELFNPTEADVDLSGLKLDDEEGGSRPYTIPAGTIIKAGEYLVFGRQDTKLALNNTSDSVRLLLADNTIITEVRYDDVPEATAYIQDQDENWIWTGTLTPGEINIITEEISATAARTVKTSSGKKVKPIIQTTLENLRNEDIGDLVKVSGVVAVEPGVLGSQYFYIVGSPGVQVYMYKKDFPNLQVGDRIEVTGEITESGGETRIKLKEKSDIVKLKSEAPPQPQTTEISEIGEPLEGWLIEIHGEITEIKGSYMFVDDGTEEVKVYFKQGAKINRKLLQVGDLVSITGLVNQTKTGYQILPRAQTDIVKTGMAEDAIIQLETMEQDESKEVAEKYLTATAGGLTSILFGLFAKSRGAATGRVFKRVGLVAIGLLRRRK